MERVVVTGATSMIGVALIKEAIKQGALVYAIVRPNSTRINRLPDSKQIYLIEQEISSLSAIEDLPDADVFYHLAWAGTMKSERDDPMIQERNIKYALDAVELAAKCHCRKFIGAGSQAEYGIVPESITETTVANPCVAYGMAKLSANMLCRKACEQKRMDFVWGRIFSVYGINDNAGTMLEYAIEKFMSGQKAFFSDGTQIWNYLYEEDAGKIFYLLGINSVNGIFNVANKQSYPLRKYIEKLAEVSRHKFNFDVKYCFEVRSADNVVSLNSNMTKFVNLIGDIPMTKFEDGITNVIFSKLSDNPGGVYSTQINQKFDSVCSAEKVAA